MRQAVIFIGHGSPMNLIEENEWTKQWEKLAQKLTRPRAILMISAHWFTAGTYIQTTPHPSMVYDMYGFPPELYALQYPAATDPAFIGKITQALSGIAPVQPDPDRGYDHGNYAVLLKMFPQADIPVIQLSIDRRLPAAAWFRIGKALAPLRDDGLLMIGSGNLVHNLQILNPQMGSTPLPAAKAFDDAVIDLTLALSDPDAPVRTRAIDQLLAWQNLPGAGIAAAYPDHLSPFFYTLGCLAGPTDLAENPLPRPAVFCRDYTMGSLSMTCLAWDLVTPFE